MQHCLTSHWFYLKSPIGVVNILFFNFECFILVAEKIIKNKILLVKVRPTSLINVRLVGRRAKKMLWGIRNWERWSEILSVRLPDNESDEIPFVNMLPIIVFAMLVILVGCKMYAKKELRIQKFIHWIVVVIIQ